MKLTDDEMLILFEAIEDYAIKHENKKDKYGKLMFSDVFDKVVDLQNKLIRNNAENWGNVKVNTIDQYGMVHLHKVKNDNT